RIGQTALGKRQSPDIPAHRCDAYRSAGNGLPPPAPRPIPATSDSTRLPRPVRLSGYQDRRADSGVEPNRLHIAPVRPGDGADAGLLQHAAPPRPGWTRPPP